VLVGEFVGVVVGELVGVFVGVLVGCVPPPPAAFTAPNALMRPPEITFPARAGTLSAVDRSIVRIWEFVRLKFTASISATTPVT
jgi:hypothetical protein